MAKYLKNKNSYSLHRDVNEKKNNKKINKGQLVIFLDNA